MFQKITALPAAGQRFAAYSKVSAAIACDAQAIREG
jgi:hypothetical protein